MILVHPKVPFYCYLKQLAIINIIISDHELVLSCGTLILVI